MKVYLTNKNRPEKNHPVPPRSAAQLMIGRLNEELQRRLKRLRELERVLIIEDDYRGDVRPLWSEYNLVEQEANRLKGAMGALRWASGKSAELDVDLPGHVILPTAEIKSYERREQKRQATFGGVEVDREQYQNQPINRASRYSDWDT